MAYLPPLAKLFGKSPFKPIHMHVLKVKETVDLLKPAIEAFCNEEFDEVDRLAEEISKLEHECDIIKNDIREHLPKSIFMPIDRSDLLIFLKDQDTVADKAEDAVILMSVRQTKNIPDDLKKQLIELTGKVVDAVDALEIAASEISDLLESSFSKKEINKMLDIIHKIDDEEWASDKIGLELVKTLYQHEDELGHGVSHLMHIADVIGDVADYAENAGDRLRVMIAK